MANVLLEVILKDINICTRAGEVYYKDLFEMFGWHPTTSMQREGRAEERRFGVMNCIFEGCCFVKVDAYCYSGWVTGD